MVDDDSKTSDTQGQSALQLHRACLDQAENLVSAAERLLADNPLPNIAYHLAVLALEEIGKGCLVVSRYVAGGSKDTGWIDKRLDDHVFKLTWAIWTPLMDRGHIDPEDFEEARRVAKRIHARRLNSLLRFDEFRQRNDNAPAGNHRCEGRRILNRPCSPSSRDGEGT